MEPLNLMLIGAGMMGARHLRGHAELERTKPGSLKLRAICEPQEDVAASVAAEAQELFGYAVPTYPSTDDALAAEDGIEAADVVTGNRSHDPIAVPLLESGIHVMIEKPLGLTIERAQRIINAARESDRVLAVAENNRRDPINRLCRHIIESGLIGEPQLVIQAQVNVGRNILASVWRHATSMGGLALDIGIHQGYMLEMLLGPIDTIYAQSRQVWPTRLDPQKNEIPVESDDVFTATVLFESGVRGTWTMDFAGVGKGMYQRDVFGTLGTLETTSGRSGNPPKVKLEGEELQGHALLERVPEFELNEIDTALWGGKLASYSQEGPITDRKLIAAELDDFITSVRTGCEPEVPGELGIRGVAIIYSLLESCASGCPVRVDDVLSGEVRCVQDTVEAAGG
ncbi:MAG TPA: Gfo/Idh/MocA family oxidoreductase [Armatimonadota bacterium]|nr:Gfo/Idh/MocA family oxidoreductase [Armatimonadota bacterium]